MGLLQTALRVLKTALNNSVWQEAAVESPEATPNSPGASANSPKHQHLAWGCYRQPWATTVAQWHIHLASGGLSPQLIQMLASVLHVTW